MVGVVRSQANLLTYAIDRFANDYEKDLIVSTLNILPSAVSAAGTNQTTATPLPSQVSVVTVCVSGAGVIATMPYHKLYNRTANPLLFYPSSGAQFETYGTNSPVVVASGGIVELLTTSQKQGWLG